MSICLSLHRSTLRCFFGAISQRSRGNESWKTLAIWGTRKLLVIFISFKDRFNVLDQFFSSPSLPFLEGCLFFKYLYWGGGGEEAAGLVISIFFTTQ